VAPSPTSVSWPVHPSSPSPGDPVNVTKPVSEAVLPNTAACGPQPLQPFCPGSPLSPSFTQTPIPSFAAWFWDFNNDGLPDLLIGSQRFGDYHGSIFIWYGDNAYVPSYDPNTWITYENATFWFTPPSNYGAWGSMVRWIGDINNDGYTDIAVGDPNWDKMYNSSNSQYPNKGRVSVFY
jgi:hypothetical protein